VADQGAGRVELEHRGRRDAALLGELWRLGRGHLVVGAERGAAAVDDPDVVLGVHRHADGRSEQPVVRQRLGPERVDLEDRRFDLGLRVDRGTIERGLRHPQGRQHREKQARHEQVSLVGQLPHGSTPRESPVGARSRVPSAPDDGFRVCEA
jgi:hypothetical protein